MSAGVIAAAGAAAAFNPLTDAGASPLVWLDAADASVFSYASGTVVSQWRDKGPSANHMNQATAGKQPSRSGTRNSLSTVVFGNGHKLRCVNAAPITVGGFTAFMVYQKTAAPTYIALPFTLTTAGNAARPLDGWTDGSGVNNRYINSVFKIGYFDLRTTGWGMLSSALDGTNYTEWRDGTLFATGAHGGGALTSSGQVLVVASRDDEVTQLVGDIAEILIYPTLSTTPRQAVEAYLRAKWATP